jgi:hypothetical protein
MGRADGYAAAGLGDDCRIDPCSAGALARGRTADEFAWYLWGGRPGCPPTSLFLNAIHWYATGFAHGLELYRREPRHR